MAKKIVMKLFKGIMSVVFSIIQVVCLPLNMLFSSVFPDLTSYINQITSTLNTAFSGFRWAFDIIPPMARTLIVGFILPTELLLIPIFKSTHLTSRAWSILQKLKFW